MFSVKRVPALQEAGHELLRVESRKSQCAGTDVEVQLDVQLAPTSDELDAESLRAALEAALGAQVASASVPLPLTLPLPPSLSSRSEQQHPTRAIAAGRKSGACDSRDLSALLHRRRVSTRICSLRVQNAQSRCWTCHGSRRAGRSSTSSPAT